ncbi:hypothetical protein [Labilithrix luteola]|uniref:hypothetical protein n=1 Tax=Labilithrix luteola TaxID=1391654 RepID=UPI0011BA71DF|nr:hypothetical protein [Labilithrix luteola]
MFDEVTVKFEVKFGAHFDLVEVLSKVAYEAVDRGEEARTLADILDLLEPALRRAEIKNVNASEVVNWLVSNDVLVASPNSRVVFFHQSATEYLAACELARKFRLDRSVLEKTLRLTRWIRHCFLR